MAEKSTESSQSARASQSQAAAGAQQPSSGQPAAQPSQRAREPQVGRGSGALERRPSGPVVGPFGASPFSLMRRMMEDLDRMFEDFGSPRGSRGGLPDIGGRSGLGMGGGLGMGWTPAVEMFERDGQLVIRADLPGLSPDDVRIEVTDDSLVIEGERRSEMEAEEEGVYRSERTYGRFSRVIALPEGVDPEGAQARFENGVLEVSLPLSQQTQRRRIPIQGSTGTGQQQSGSSGPMH